MNKNCSVIAICFLISACVPGVSQSSKFYNTTSEVDSVLSTTYSNSVAVLRVQMPKFMDKPQIISRNREDVQVFVSEYNRWIEPLSMLYTRTLVENLNTLLPNAPVEIFMGNNSPSRYVFVDVVKLDTLWNSKITLDAWYTIKTYKDQLIIRRKFSDSIPLKNSYEDLVRVHSKLLGNLSKSIADSLIKHDKKYAE